LTTQVRRVLDRHRRMQAVAGGAPDPARL